MADEEPTGGGDLRRAMQDLQPAHLRDGLGVRGPQSSSPSGENPETQRRTDAPGGSIVRQPLPASTDAATSEADVSEVDDVYGAEAGQPAIFHFKRDSAPSPVPPP